MRNFRIICFTAIFLMVMAAGFAHAQTVNPARSQNNDFEARCEDLKSKYTCTTKFYKDADNIEIWCTTQSAESKEQPVSALMSVMYKCHPEKQGGKEVWVCKWGWSPKIAFTLTREEFKDTQTRCGRICRSCPEGWK